MIMCDIYKNAEIEDELISVELNLQAPSASCCSACGTETSSVIRCLDCSYMSLYCEACEKDIHSKIYFHKPELWKVCGYYV